MGLDIYHLRVVKPQYCKKDHTFSLSKFPVLMDKFKNFVFMDDIEYIDWDKTFDTLNKKFVSNVKFEDYHCFMSSYKGYYFQYNKGENLDDIDVSKEQISNEFIMVDNFIFVPLDKVVTYFQKEPHISYKEVGYQRKWVVEEFYEKMENGMRSTDIKTVKQAYRYCVKDAKPSFKKLFIDNWDNNLDIFTFDW